MDILAERENIYRLLSQTADGSGGGLKDGFKSFTIDPSTRYVVLTQLLAMGGTVYGCFDRR